MIFWNLCKHCHEWFFSLCILVITLLIEKIERSLLHAKRSTNIIIKIAKRYPSHAKRSLILISILIKVKSVKKISINRSFKLHYSRNLGIDGYRLYTLTLYLRYPWCFRMVLRAQLQKYFQRKTYLCKERQKSFSIKMGLKLHRSRNLETDGFWLDALILYLRYPRCVRMLLRANCSRLWSKYSQNEEKQI